jgi:hypothetical protein
VAPLYSQLSSKGALRKSQKLSPDLQCVPQIIHSSKLPRPRAHLITICDTHLLALRSVCSLTANPIQQMLTVNSVLSAILIAQRTTGDSSPFLMSRRASPSGELCQGGREILRPVSRKRSSTKIFLTALIEFVRRLKSRPVASEKNHPKQVIGLVVWKDCAQGLQWKTLERQASTFPNVSMRLAGYRRSHLERKVGHFCIVAGYRRSHLDMKVGRWSGEIVRPYKG